MDQNYTSGIQWVVVSICINCKTHVHTSPAIVTILYNPEKERINIVNLLLRGLITQTEYNLDVV